ncbi:MAG TPA: hypothetical protein VGC79_37095, partial [Polyangiaceae bacterium]
MQIIHSGRGPALLLACALSITVSCGSAERNYRANERNADSDGGAANAGKNSNSGGSRAAGAGTGGCSSPLVGSAGTSGFAPAAGGSLPFDSS